MDLSFRSLVMRASCRQEQRPFATSQSWLLTSKAQTRIVRCNVAAEGDERSARGRVVAKTTDPTSWSDTQATSDSFSGWTSDNSPSNENSMAGWIRVGGFAVVAVGLAIGSQAPYTRQVGAKVSGAVLPVIEQFWSSTKKTKSEEVANVTEYNQMDVDRTPQDDGATPDMQQRKVDTTKRQGNVLVPASVDLMQEQILTALQALKVIEADVKAGDICKRRDYARWLIAASNKLSRNPAHKVFPAMYIDGASKLAYADVLPTDEDFPSIQGLAEAGLISSQLLWEDTLEADSSSHFAPESPLTRQDLLTWRMALEREPFLQTGNSALPTKMDVQNLSGFLDIDKIQQDAWPALLADVKSGERSIVALAFGYTRRFQPEKPVTKGQAAVALATGQAWEFVSEELARQEAESMAEAAVVAELGLETQGQQEETADFNEFIEKGILKQHGSSIVSGGLQAQLEQVKAEHEEKLALLKEHAELECTKDLLTKMKHDVEEEVRILSSAKLEVSFQKGQVDKLHAEAQEEKEKISKIRSELEVEKKALYLARVWAEEEARRASAHSKLLEQARKRWELGGIKVRVAEELSDANIPGPSWKYSEHLHGQVRFPVQWLAQKSNDSIKALRDALLRFFHLVVLFCQAIQQRSTEFTIGVGNRISGVKTKCSDSVTSTLDGIKQVMPSVTQLATSIKECTSRSIAECKGGAERLVERFKVA